jgi:hypothetical protein
MDPKKSTKIWKNLNFVDILEATAGKSRIRIRIWNTASMDEGTIKTPRRKCRLYWCLIEFIDWKYSQSCWYFRPALCSIAPLTSSLVSSPPSPPLPV